MNFLAHLVLSCQSEELIVGNYLADFIKNRQLEKYSLGIQEGVQLHRKIDSFTDAHPIVKAASRRLRPKHGHYAPVCLDIFMDYILCQEWEHYVPQPLDEFCAYVYEVLLRYRAIMPPKIAKRTSHMVADNWLPKYGTYEGIDYTFYRLSQRVSKPQLLSEAVESLKEQEEQLKKDFAIFFPEIMAFVSDICAC